MTDFLVVFDVDSTLIEDEVIELLAEVAGKRAEVAAVTERAMRGELDFAESLRERVRALENLPHSVFEAVYQRITLTTGVQELIDAIHALGGKAGAVSGGFTEVLTPLAARLNLDFYRANELEIRDAKLTGKVQGRIIDKTAKAEALQEWAAQLNLPLSKTMAVGDGANDLEMMAIAKLGVAFNAKPIVKEQADVVIEEHDLRAVIPYLSQL